MYGLSDNNGDIFSLNEGEKAFLKSSLYPAENEQIKIGEINKKGKLEESSLYLQFYPCKIPNYNTEFKAHNSKTESVSETTQVDRFAKSSLNKIQELNGVVIKATPGNTRTKDLKAKSYGQVDVFDDEMRQHNPRLTIYFSRRRYASNDLDKHYQ